MNSGTKDQILGFDKGAFSSTQMPKRWFKWLGGKRWNEKDAQWHRANVVGSFKVDITNSYV